MYNGMFAFYETFNGFLNADGVPRNTYRAYDSKGPFQQPDFSSLVVQHSTCVWHFGIELNALLLLNLDKEKLLFVNTIVGFHL